MGQALVGIRCGGVDPGAAGQHQTHRLNRVVRVVPHPAGHTARVVGDHSADTRGCAARWIRSEDPAKSCDSSIRASQDGTRLRAQSVSLVLDGDVVEVPPDIEQDVIALRLSVEARARGSQDDPATRARREAEHPGNVASVPGHDDHPRHQTVGAGIGGVADQVGDRAQDVVRADDTLQLGRPRIVRGWAPRHRRSNGGRRPRPAPSLLPPDLLVVGGAPVDADELMTSLPCVVDHNARTLATASRCSPPLSTTADCGFLTRGLVARSSAAGGVLPGNVRHRMPHR